MTWPGFSEFFLGQDKALIELTAMDAWVLGQRKLSQLSEADRKDQVSDRYVTDYINQWQNLLSIWMCKFSLALSRR